MFRVDVKFLKDNPGESMRVQLAGTLPPIGEGAGKIEFSGPVQLNGELTGAAGSVLVKGTVRATVRLICARCLEPFLYSLEVPLEEVYYYAGKGEEDWISFTGATINMEPEIIKAIVLEIPMKAVCREECRGFCPDCGKNLNTGECQCNQKKVDPRLAILEDFFK